MKSDEKNISGYLSHAIVLVVLLVLTTISVLVTGYHLGALSVAVALIIASVKVRTVIAYFMHIRFESLFMKLMVTAVFVIFGLIIIITFIDYMLR